MDQSLSTVARSSGWPSCVAPLPSSSYITTPAAIPRRRRRHQGDARPDSRRQLLKIEVLDHVIIGANRHIASANAATFLPEPCRPSPPIGPSSLTPPQSDRNHDGDEIPVWTVYVGDEEGTRGPGVHLPELRHCRTPRPAHREDRRIELITDACPHEYEPIIYAYYPSPSNRDGYQIE